MRGLRVCFRMERVSENDPSLDDHRAPCPFWSARPACRLRSLGPDDGEHSDVREPRLLLAFRLRRTQSHCIVHERMVGHLGGFGVPQPYPPIDVNNIVMCEAPEEYQID